MRNLFHQESMRSAVEIHSVIYNVEMDMLFFENFEVAHYFQEANKIANFCANKNHSCLSLTVWKLSIL